MACEYQITGVVFNREEEIELLQNTLKKFSSQISINLNRCDIDTFILFEAEGNIEYQEKDNFSSQLDQLCEELNIDWGSSFDKRTTTKLQKTLANPRITKTEVKDIISFQLLHAQTPKGIRLEPCCPHRDKEIEWGEDILSSYDSLKWNIYYKGNIVGYMKRNLRTGTNGEKEVVLDGLYINKEFSGKGLGNKIQKFYLQEYKKKGIQSVSLTAVEVGSYTWAKKGFLFDPRKVSTCLYDNLTTSQKEDPLILSAISARNLLNESLHQLEYLYGEKITAQIEKQFYPSHHDLPAKGDIKRFIHTPAQILELGKGLTFINDDGEKIWPGKTILVSTVKDALTSAHWARTGESLEGEKLSFSPRRTPGWSGIKFL